MQAVVVAVAFCQRAFERLEPIAGKLARWVLRRGSGSNIALLSDLCRPSSQIMFNLWVKVPEEALVSAKAVGVAREFQPFLILFMVTQSKVSVG